MSNVLKIDRHGGVTLFTLNRPERHNALTKSLARDFEAAVEEFGRDSAQRVLIITGAGEKAFCSGVDLSEMREEATQGVSLPTAPDQDLMGIGRCEKPVIAAINGLAVGGGLEIAICSDIRVAAESAWFGLPEVERGFIAGIAAVTLPRLMPIGAVMDIMLTGNRMGAQDAYRLGFVQQVVPAGDLMKVVMERADRMSRHSQAALWGTKQVIRQWRNRALLEHHEHYLEVVGRVLSSGDYEEGLKAFAEKRQPQFDLGWSPGGTAGN
jgi:enoyl-CoA hydratase/carnithine racemase